MLKGTREEGKTWKRKADRTGSGEEREGRAGCGVSSVSYGDGGSRRR
jgi:hypothetical protein